MPHKNKTDRLARQRERGQPPRAETAEVLEVARAWRIAAGRETALVETQRERAPVETPSEKGRRVSAYSPWRMGRHGMRKRTL